MNLIRILQSVEELLYELALWIVLIPKTFVKVVFQPGWAQSYITAEFDKEPGERFDEYVSPMLFWAIVCVIPYLITVDTFSILFLKSGHIQKFASLPLEAKFLSIAVFLICEPLGVSIGILKAIKKSIGRKSMRRIFSTQCLCFSPAYLFLLPFVTIELAAGLHLDFKLTEPASMIEMISASMFFWWLLYAEIRIITAELKIGWIKAAGRLIAYLFLSLLLMFLMEFILIWIIF